MAFNFSFTTPAPAPAPAAAGGFSFGAPAPAPAAGGFSFGAPAPAPAAAGGFSFGAPAPAPAPAAGGFSFGGFGAAPAPAAAAAPAAAPAFGFGGFGAPAPAPAPSTGFSFTLPGQSTAPTQPAPATGGLFSQPTGLLFGAQPAQPQQQAAVPTPQPKDRQDVIVEGVVPVLNKYAAQDAGPLADTKRLLQGLYKSDPYTYRFKSVAYNIRDPTAAYLRPPLLTSEEWDKECAEHATDDSVAPALPLIPVAIDGFEGLNARMDAQDAQVKEFLKSSEQLLAAVQNIRLAVDRSNDTLARVRDKQVSLNRRLLRVSTKVEGVISRGKPELPEEAALRQQLTSMRERLVKHDAVAARIDTLLRAQRSKEEAAHPSSSSSASGASVSLSDVDGLKRQLEVQRGGIEQLLTVVRKDARDLRIMRSQLEQDAAKARSGDHMQRGY